MIAAVVAKVFHLFIKRDHHPRRLRAGLAWVPMLATTTVVAAGLGALADTYRFTGGLEATAPTSAAAENNAAVLAPITSR